MTRAVKIFAMTLLICAVLPVASSACDIQEQKTYCNCRADGTSISKCQKKLSCSTKDLDPIEQRLNMASCEESDPKCTKEFHEKMCNRVIAILNAPAAPNIKKAVKAFEAGDYKAALHKFEQLDSPEARSYMGVMYMEGKGVPVDKAKAFELIKRAAEQGVPEAKYRYGLALWTGENIPSNFFGAYPHLLSAAIDNVPEAAFDVATFLYTRDPAIPDSYGNTVFSDPEQAFKMFKKAYDNGDTYACYNIGIMYLQGGGVKKDPAKAVKWLDEAVNQGTVTAAMRLGLLYAFGDGNVQKDTAKALHYYELAAKHGEIEDQIKVGHILEDFEDEQALSRAYYWLTKVANTENPYAAYRAGIMSKNGRGTKKDPKTAAKYILIAAQGGRPEAQLEIARFYQDGYGVEQDSQEAARWFTPLAEAGDTDVQYELGLLYYELDLPKALSWISKAAQNGNARAQEELGMMYFTATGAGKDLGLAFFWLSLAKLNGESIGSFFPEALLSQMQPDEIMNAQDSLLKCLKAGLQKGCG